jgi:hypothetical protein
VDNTFHLSGPRAVCIILTVGRLKKLGIENAPAIAPRTVIPVLVY